MSLIPQIFCFRSTADEVVAKVNFTVNRIIVTVSASGIGIETAPSLARTSASAAVFADGNNGHAYPKK